MNENATKELNAIKVVYGALEPLDDEARVRILLYIRSLLASGQQPEAAPQPEEGDGE